MAGRAHGLAGGVVVGLDAGAHQAEHHVVAGAHRQVGIHPGGVGHGGVGDHHAHEAPFIAQHVGEQGFGAAGPGGAQVGVAGHDRGGLALLDRDLKGLEVQLAHSLLVAPDGQGQTVGLLIVQGEVLGVAVDALGGGALDLGRAQLAGEQTVLGIVLEVAPAEGGAVDVHARGVQAHDAVGQGLRAEDAAEFLHQLHVPGGADDGLAGEGDALEGADQGVDAGGAVQIGGGGLAHGGHGGGGPAAVEDHGGHVLIAELLEQQLPLGIVPVEPGHVLQCQAVVGVDDGGVGTVDFIGGLLGEGLHHRIGGRLAVLPGLGGGARPVGAGDVNRDLAVLHVGKVGHGGGLVGGAGIALAVDHGVLHGIGPAVDGLVGVVHEPDLVIAGLQHIAAGAEGIEGGHVLRGKGHGHGLGGAGLQQAGLGKADQRHMGLLDAALGIGGGVIDLHHVLARSVAGIGDLHLQGDGAAAVHIGLNALLKAGVAQAVAEGVLDGAVIVDEAVGRGGLVVAVAHVDALGILHVVAGVQVAVSKVAGVPEGGGRGQIIGIGVHQTAGGVHRTGEHFAHRVEAHRAGAAHPEGRVHAVLQEAQLHGVGGVDEHDDLGEALGLDQRQQILLVLRQLQVVPPVVGLAVARGKHILGQVAALAADAGEDDDRRVGEVLRLLQDRVGVGGGGDLCGGEVGAGVAALLGALHAGVPVELHQLFVDLQAGVLQALDHVHIGGGVAGAAAGAAVDRVDGAVAEEVDPGAAGQGQGAVFVAEQDDALLLQTLSHGKALFRGLGHAEHVGAPGGLGAGDHGVQIHAHPRGDHGLERAAGDVDRQGDDQQDRQKNDAAFFHGLTLSSSQIAFVLDKSCCNMIISTQC